MKIKPCIAFCSKKERFEILSNCPICKKSSILKYKKSILDFINKETLIGGPAYSNFLNREWIGKRDVIDFLESLSLPDQEQLSNSKTE